MREELVAKGTGSEIARFSHRARIFAAVPVSDKD
jgi:hypothetical protein